MKCPKCGHAAYHHVDKTSSTYSYTKWFKSKDVMKTVCGQDVETRAEKDGYMRIDRVECRCDLSPEEIALNTRLGRKFGDTTP